jgi:glucose/arabinose dehydrogenase
MKLHLGLLLLIVSTATAQQRGGPPIGVPAPKLTEKSYVFDTAEQHKLRVVVVTKGLSHPWSMAWLPDGNMLVTERVGKLRVIRDGVLDPKAFDGVPAVHAVRLSGLMDVVLHPKWAENKRIYLTYTKDVGPNLVATTLATGTFDGKTLSNVHDIFVASPPWDGAGGSGSRITFGPDGKLYMSTGASNGNGGQDPNSHMGKVLRLNDDGTAPKDNPFVGRAGYKPEIFSMGHRNSLALVFNPTTGVLWNNENGPNGGDEINIIQAGKNYGWPLVSFGRDYSGPRISENPYREGMEMPVVTWLPAIAPSGMAFYTGDKFPAWKGNVFVGAMRVGEIPGTGHLERLVINEKNEEVRRESMLTELRQRIRDVRQGPDGFLYLLTDEDDAALLRLEPAQ